MIYATIITQKRKELGIFHNNVYQIEAHHLQTAAHSTNL